jgi:glycosyltransferase involved in cell wall biosynthesis
MGNYLGRCLDSLLLPEITDKIEVIIVNDGSTDKSLLIARSYKTKFPATIVVIDKDNGNMGSCYNAGLKAATGKYFRPLDADDWFDRQSFVQYVNILQNTEADMIITNYSGEYSNGKSIVKYSKKHIKNITPAKIYDFKKYSFDNTQNHELFRMHSITYSTKLLTNMNFKFTEGVLYVDTEYCFYPLKQVTDFMYLDTVLYKYCIGREGQSVSEISIAKNKEHPYKIIRRMIEYFNSGQNEVHETVKDKQYAIFNRILELYYRAILICNNRNIEDNNKLKEIDSFLKRFNSTIYNTLGKQTHTCIRTRYIYLWRKNGKYYKETVSYKFYSLLRKLKNRVIR